MPIQPISPTGLAVLLIFSIGMALIVFEAKLRIDKFKPALFMLTAFLPIGLYTWLSGDDPQHFVEMQKENAAELFSLVAFMAFMWMIVEILAERSVFSALNNYLIRKGLGAKQMFWATGALAALLSPFINNITTAMIFGKSILEISRDRQYSHIALCNLIIASNSGVWFLGTATSLMVVLAGKISIAGLLALFPAGFIGWAAGAWVLQTFYLNRLQGELISATPGDATIKHGGWGMVFFGALAIACAVTMNISLHVNIEYALGMGLSIIGLYAWHLKRRYGTDVALLQQLQKVEWNTLLFFIGIISGVAALNYTGWLGYISGLFDHFSPTAVNVLLGAISGILDNVPVEAAALMSAPQLDHSQWALNALMVGIGGSLTVIGSAAGIMAMTLDKSYSFSTHLKFMPAILANFFASLGVWYVQFEMLR